VKNFFTVTLLALGLPMIMMGDEVRRTQHGNNNAYCQDNATSWLDWTLMGKHADVHRFVALMTSRRRLRDVEPEQHHVTLNQLLAEAHQVWHGVKLGQPDWSDYSHSIALCAEARNEKMLFHFMLNAYREQLEFELPRTSSENPWRRWIDTALESPDDIVDWQGAPLVAGKTYRVEPHSVAVLFAHESGPHS
jgi:glycogen operon protein